MDGTLKNWLIFAGQSSKDYGMFISGVETFNGAERDVTDVEVPGRDGSLTIDNGRYKDVPLTYRAFVHKKFQGNVQAFRNILLMSRGYQRLEDTFHLNEFRLAKFTGQFESEPKKNFEFGGFDINFLCYPQRFLKSGEVPQTFTTSNNLFNQHLTTTKPLVRVYGTGTVTIGGIPITIVNADSYTDIDCETESAYRGSVNCNGNIQLSDGKFWSLKPGANQIVLGSGITSIEITPRWWIL